MARRFTVEITEIFMDRGVSPFLPRPTVRTSVSGRSMKSVMRRVFEQHRRARREVGGWSFMLTVWATRDGAFLFGRGNNSEDLARAAGFPL